MSGFIKNSWSSYLYGGTSLCNFSYKDDYTISKILKSELESIIKKKSNKNINDLNSKLNSKNKKQTSKKQT